MDDRDPQIAGGDTFQPADVLRIQGSIEAELVAQRVVQRHVDGLLPRMALAASPGSAWVAAKTTTETSKSVSTPSPMRIRINFSRGGMEPPPPAGLEGSLVLAVACARPACGGSLRSPPP